MKGCACVDARELCVVEDIEGFQTELNLSALVGIADVEVLEDRQVGVVNPRIPQVCAFAQAQAAKLGDDERTD